MKKTIKLLILLLILALLIGSIVFYENKDKILNKNVEDNLYNDSTNSNIETEAQEDIAEENVAEDATESLEETEDEGFKELEIPQIENVQETNNTEE